MAAKSDKRDLSNVLIGGIEKVDIRVVDYDSKWPLLFGQHAARIASALGNAALRIEHIGSTSVPNLPAKPIVDILLIVKNSADEASYLPALEAAGYQLRVRDPEDDEHRMLRTPTRDVHIHVYSLGSSEAERLLNFRDRLRASAPARDIYANTKRTLASRPWSDMNAYADAKTDIIKKILTDGGAKGT